MIIEKFIKNKKIDKDKWRNDRKT